MFVPAILRNRFALRTGLTGVAGAVAASVLISADGAAPRADWPTYGGSFDHQRFSTLQEVNRTNAARLAVAWTFEVPDTGGIESSLQTTPLVVRGSDAGLPGVDAVMLLTSPRDRVIALDAATGKVLWTAQPALRTLPGLCCSISNRGVAFGHVERDRGKPDARVYVATLDARLWAFSAASGSPTIGFGDGVGPAGSVTVAPAGGKGLSLTMAPLFIPRSVIPGGGATDDKDVIIVGSSGGEFEARGFVTAYDALTGARLWRFATIPSPGEFGGETWPLGVGGVFADPQSRGGGTSWMTPAYDPVRGYVFVTVGNPAPNLDGTHRAGDNLFTDSVLALDVRTGQRIWHYQEVHHDLWDFDPASPPFLLDVRNRPAVAQAGKTGFMYVLDRETGVPLFPCPETPVPGSNVVAPDGSPEITSATQPLCPTGLQFVPLNRPGDPVPTTGPMANLRPIFTPPGADRPVAPALLGGSEWSPVSFHPGLGLAFVSGLVAPFRLFPLPEFMPQPGNFWLGGLPLPMLFRFGGVLTAIDMNAGSIRWQKPTFWPLVGGSLATAGGLVFYGEGYPLAGAFVAVDASSGRELFRYWTRGGVNAAPMTYQANGHQFVSVAAGGHPLFLSRIDNLLLTFALKENP
jgi:alcohol dehydrogenase (cytochrome c)